MSKIKIRAAVIGVGNMGRHHARIYSSLSNYGVSLLSVADSNLQRAREIGSQYGCTYYSDYQKMFSENQIDLVSIAVPTVIHKEVVLGLSSYKPNVLLEKPVAGSLADAIFIEKLTRSWGKIAAIGNIERFNPAVEYLKNTIDRGYLGRINTLVANRVGMAPPPNKITGVTIDLAIHEIDVFYWLLGKLPKKCYCSKSTVVGDTGEDSVSLLFDYGGISGFIHANWITPLKVRKLQVTGTKGYAELDYIAQDLVTHKRNSDVSLLSPRRGYKEILNDRTRMIRHKIKHCEPLKMEILDIVKCIRYGGLPRTTVKDGISVLKIALNAIGRS